MQKCSFSGGSKSLKKIESKNKDFKEYVRNQSFAVFVRHDKIDSLEIEIINCRGKGDRNVVVQKTNKDRRKVSEAFKE